MCAGCSTRVRKAEHPFAFGVRRSPYDVLVLKAIEICAGAGGQALGVEQAGFAHDVLVELDPWACETLRVNRPTWEVVESDVREFSAAGRSVDLLAGGVPCPPFSVAGKQLGPDDERDLFPEALRLVSECRPRAVMLENVRGLLSPKFADYRESLGHELASLGYWHEWALLNASDHGVPQLRPRAILVALRPEDARRFQWPDPRPAAAPTVGDVLRDQMAAANWEGADAWARRADRIAPTIVGGSKKHGGPDLGPTRAKREWAKLGVCGMGIANEPPPPGFTGQPRLTVEMAARLQGFPSSWRFAGRKTNAYRQVGNAFPPPVARAVAGSIAMALGAATDRLGHLAAA
jgi:DNA (cytosine-5)-methyltransferase 1